MNDAPILQPQLNKLRKDKFVAILTIPNILKSLNNDSRQDKFLNLDSLQFSVYNITIPRVSIPEHEVHFGQQHYNVTSYDRPAYPPVTINFEVDNEFKNYWMLWKWLQLIHDPREATYAGKNIFPEGAPKQEPVIVPTYATLITVYALDEYNNKKARFTFDHAFITELGELEYNNRDAEQQTCHFNFVFNQLDVHLLGGENVNE
jgi:hypothetical protein